MDMTDALKIADMMTANPKEWKEARIEAFDKHRDKNVELAQDAYESLTEKVEKKEERRARARAKAQEAKAKRDQMGNDSGQNQQQGEGGFNE